MLERVDTTLQADGSTTPRELGTPRTIEMESHVLLPMHAALQKKYGYTSNFSVAWSVPNDGPKPETPFLEKLFDLIGALATWLAMEPQGYLAAIILALALRFYTAPYLNNPAESPLIYYAIVAGIVGACLLAYYAASKGKEILVRFFNTETFKQLARAEWWRNTFDFKKWTLQDYVNFITNAAFTIVASAVFVYIANIACNGMSNLLKEFNHVVTDWLAMLIIFWPLKGLYMLASGFCNLFGFPYIHKGGVALLSRGAAYFVEDPVLRYFRRQLKMDLRTVRKQWQAAVLQGDKNGLTYLKDNIFKLLIPGKYTDLTSEQKMLIMGNIRILSQEINDKRKAKDKSALILRTEEQWPWFVFKHFVATGLTLFTMLGFVNFIDMAAGAAVMFKVPFLTVPMQIMDFISMSMLGAGSVYNGVMDFFESSLDNNNAIMLLSNLRQIWTYVSVILLLFVAGLPNAEQGYLAKQMFLLIATDLLASLLTELPAFLSLTVSKKTESIIAEDAAKKDYVQVDGVLGSIEQEIINADAKKLNALKNQKEIAELNGSEPLKDYRKGYTQFKENCANALIVCRETIFSSGNERRANIVEPARLSDETTYLLSKTNALPV